MASDGSFVLRVRFDVLAFMTDQTPHAGSNATLEAILDAPDPEIAARLREAEGRLRTGIEAGTALRTVEFPLLADLIAARRREAGRRLPVSGTAVFSGRLPPGARTIAFRFPATLDTVILTTEFSYQEPISEPVAPGERSWGLTVPTEAQTVATAKALGLAVPGRTTPPRRAPFRKPLSVGTGSAPAHDRSTPPPAIAAKKGPGASGASRPPISPPRVPAPKTDRPVPAPRTGAVKPPASEAPTVADQPATTIAANTGETPVPPGSSHAHNPFQNLLGYVRMGFLHILPEGIDHILFVLGLVLVATRTKDLLSQVSAFTVAHSLTLGLALFGVVRLPEQIVEPIIALSIAFVAIENVLARRVGKWRLAAVFGFGLIHGLGFAGALQDLGLGRRDLIPALVGFNVGVELGQLSVVSMALGVLFFFRSGPKYREYVVIPASLLIAAVALFWTVQRVVG